MSTIPRDPLIQSIVTTSESVQRQWKALLISEMSEEKITLAQLWALNIIGSHGSINSRKLGELMYVTSGAVTQLVDGLVAEQYVLRRADPTDRRITNLVLSESGKKKFTKLQRKRRSIFIEIFAIFNEEELSAVLSQQEKILQQLQSLQPQKSPKK